MSSERTEERHERGQAVGCCVSECTPEECGSLVESADPRDRVKAVHTLALLVMRRAGAAMRLEASDGAHSPRPSRPCDPLA